MFRRIYFYRPRSEGYVFTGVCRSVTEWGRGWGGEGGQHQRSTAYSPPGQVRGQPPTPPTVNGRAVRILLECILVRRCAHFNIGVN